jgi:hypothetical protein
MNQVKAIEAVGEIIKLYQEIIQELNTVLTDIYKSLDKEGNDELLRGILYNTRQHCRERLLAVDELINDLKVIVSRNSNDIVH